MLTVDEFENAWAMSLKKYNLKQRPYMTQIYEIRHKVGKALFQGCFLRKNDNHTTDRERQSYAEDVHASSKTDAYVCKAVHEAAI